MSLWSRFTNVFRGDRLNREIDEELRSHLDEAIERGRAPSEAARAFGSPLQQRERSLDIRFLPWLDALRADTVFGWRQLKKKKATSAAAILSLALAIGSCTSAFRLIDALLLRPLPVAAPGELYALTRVGIGFDGKPSDFDGWAYPSFRLMRDAVKDQAELVAVSYVEKTELTYKSDQEIEKNNVQYVSGPTFQSFGLRPSLGRLLGPSDDLKPGAHPYAVLSHDYWTRRFGQDPSVIGRTFRMRDTVYEIIGVGPEPFTGTEPGTVTDIFLPAMMHRAVTRPDQTWVRTIARIPPSVPRESLRQKLQATSREFERERSKGFTGIRKESIERFINQTLVLQPAAAGTSGLQKDYRRALIAIGVLVALVLLIACANVANLMTAQAAARAREMALRVSIGAGRARLVQLVLVESALLAIFAASIGALFAWWSAPFVVGKIGTVGNPVRLALPADGRVLAFGLALTFGVALLFGLAPALRASAVRPASALKGGEGPHSRRRLMHALIAAQVAFCVLVLFITGLFAATFERLSNRPTGFSAERILYSTVNPASPQSPAAWDQMADRMRTVTGVEKVALAGWPLLSRNSINGFISTNGEQPGPVLVFFLAVSRGWMDLMKIPFLDGQDFRPSDTSPGSAIVNETFAKQFFNGESPIGKSFKRGTGSYQIVGLVHDAPYRSIREPILPVAYVPFHTADAQGQLQPISYGAILVRTSSGANPLTLGPILRQDAARVNPELRIGDINTQAEVNRSQTLRERLLAMLALFFGAVALLLAGIGLYGVLDYSVLQQRREIGIRMAIGAQAGHIARRVTGEVFGMVLAGALVGLAAGLASVRYIASLLYEVKASDPMMLALPAFAIIAAALLAALPAVIRAVRIDPVAMLRSE